MGAPGSPGLPGLEATPTAMTPMISTASDPAKTPPATRRGRRSTVSSGAQARASHSSTKGPTRRGTRAQPFSPTSHNAHSKVSANTPAYSQTPVIRRMTSSTPEAIRPAPASR